MPLTTVSIAAKVSIFYIFEDDENNIKESALLFLYSIGSIDLRAGLPVFIPAITQSAQL
jgi:hypothetical protein